MGGMAYHWPVRENIHTKIPRKGLFMRLPAFFPHVIIHMDSSVTGMTGEASIKTARAPRVAEAACDTWSVRQSYFFEPDIVDKGVRMFKRE